MKNTLKNLGMVIATAVVIFAGAVNVYAMDKGVDHWPASQGDAAYERFLDIETGN